AIGEAEYVARQLTATFLEVVPVIQDLIGVLRPLFLEKGITSQIRARPDVPAVYADRVAVKEILLAMISSAIKHAENGCVDVFVDRSESRVKVEVAARPPGLVADTTAPGDLAVGCPAARLEIASRLAHALYGTLDAEWTDELGTWRARLALPMLPRSTLLV